MSGSVCPHCGLNLARIERLPTRDQWERAKDLDDAGARAIAGRLGTLEPLTPALFDVAPGERSLDHPAAAHVLEQATAKAVEERIPRAERPPGFAVQTTSELVDPTSLKITASVMLGGELRVDQDFAGSLELGKPRARVVPSGAPRLVSDGMEVGSLPEPTPYGPSAPVPVAGTVRQSAVDSYPPGWYVNPATGARQWWDGRQWAAVRASQDEQQAPQGTNGLAIASLVLGIFGGSILAIILGRIAQQQCDDTGQPGRELATAGLVLGVIGLLITIAVIVIALSAA